MEFVVEQFGNGVAVTGVAFDTVDSCNTEMFNSLKHYGNVKMFHCPRVIDIPSFIKIDESIKSVIAIMGQPFENCLDVETIVIPPTVKQIHWNGRNRQRLKEILVSPDNKYFHSIEGVLYTQKGYDRDGRRKNNDWMELIAYPNAKGNVYEVVNGTTRLGNQFFKYTNISSLSLPKTLKEIGSNSFYECRYLEKIILPHSVEKIEDCKHLYTHFILKETNIT